MSRLRFTCRHGRGISLVEMLIVVALVAILAGAAVLGLSPAHPRALDSAAGEVAAALRFARQEAGRVQMPTMVAIDAANKTVRVSRFDFSTGAGVPQTVAHPLSKLAYEIRLDRFSGGAGVGIQSVFTFSDGSTASAIAFLPTGEPGKLTSATTVQPLKDAYRWRGGWQPVMKYRAGDIVAYGPGDHVAALDHTSGQTFASDSGLGKWARNDLAAPQITLSVGEHRRRIHVAPITGLARLQQ